MWSDEVGLGQVSLFFFYQAQGNSDSAGPPVCLRSFVLENAGVLISEDSGDPIWPLSLSIPWPLPLSVWPIVLLRVSLLGKVSFYSQSLALLFPRERILIYFGYHPVRKREFL